MERWIYNRGTHVFSLPLVWVWATGQMCWMHSHRETTWSTGEKQNKTKQRQRRANSEKKKQPKWEPDIVSLGSPAVKISHEQNALILRFLSIPLLAFPLCLHVHIPEGEGIATVHLLPLGNNSSTALNLTCYPSKFSHPHSSPSHIPPLLWPVLSVYNSVLCTVGIMRILKNSLPPSLILIPNQIFCIELKFFTKRKAPRFPTCFSLYWFPSSTPPSACSLSKQHCQAILADSSEEWSTIPIIPLAPLKAMLQIGKHVQIDLLHDGCA